MPNVIVLVENTHEMRDAKKLERKINELLLDLRDQYKGYTVRFTQVIVSWYYANEMYLIFQVG